MMVSTWDGDELSMIRFHHHSMSVFDEQRERWLSQHEYIFDELEALGLYFWGCGLIVLLLVVDDHSILRGVSWGWSGEGFCQRAHLLSPALQHVRRKY